MPADSTITNPIGMSVPDCSSVLPLKYAFDPSLNYRLIYGNISVRYFNPLKRKGRVKTKNDDDVSCAVPNDITMKKTTAALFNALFLIRCFSLSANYLPTICMPFRCQELVLFYALHQYVINNKKFSLFTFVFEA